MTYGIGAHFFTMLGFCLILDPQYLGQGAR
jgi:hypothetical protein